MQILSWSILSRRRGEALRMYYDLDISHLATSTDINDLRAQRRLWQQNLNAEVQKITLELMVNIFRYLP